MNLPKTFTVHVSRENIDKALNKILPTLAAGRWQTDHERTITTKVRNNFCVIAQSHELFTALGIMKECSVKIAIYTTSERGLSAPYAEYGITDTATRDKVVEIQLVYDDMTAERLPETVDEIMEFSWNYKRLHDLVGDGFDIEYRLSHG